MSVRVVTCRYVKPQSGQQCTAEAVDPDGELLICARHLAMAQRLIQQAMARPRSGGR
ncbi:hypothetical protein GCM10023347_33710 [Streptomyces chumphonensis]|uniref:Uncharacterized protein n=1 Tax=Streptomyces chumphonensis TaxID=1214925 RepID=A0A927EXQ5_9ACTN|nr:hypothetical protein [Streptomyces chumphonensis]MBD3931959.1 hypothetical protein [Streptomyces chumphonensis]